MSILEEILNTLSKAGRAGKNASSIAVATGLVYQDCVRRCWELADAQLLRSWRDERSLIFMITTEGLETLSEIQRFLDLTRSKGLRC